MEKEHDISIPEVGATFTPPQVPTLADSASIPYLPDAGEMHLTSMQHIRNDIEQHGFYRLCCKMLADNQGRLNAYGTTINGVFTREFVAVCIPSAIMDSEVEATIENLELKNFTGIRRADVLYLSWDPKVFIDAKGHETIG